MKLAGKCQYTDKELLEVLKNYYNKTKKIPTTKDFNSKNGLPSFSAYRLRFKNLKTVFELAEITIPEHRKKDFTKVRYTDDELLKILKEYNDKNGFPVSKKFNGKDYPDNETYKQRFGSWHNSLLKAGIEIPDDKMKYFQNDRLTNEKLLDDLKKITEEHLQSDSYLPTTDELDNYKEIQSTAVYNRRFGGIKNAYKLIGIDFDEFNKNAMKQDMVNKLIEIKEQLGRIPTNDDINFFSQSSNDYYYSASTYEHNFGGIADAQIACGFEISQATKTKRMSKKEALQILINFYKETGKIPSQMDVNTPYNNLPSYGYYVNKFGSWENVIQEAFGKQIKRLTQFRKTKSGKICRSLLEYIYACMLEKYNIKYEIDDIHYKDYIQDLDKDYRFDFLIKHNNELIFIEIFGLIGFKDYDKKIEEKIKLCKDNSLNLIDLYPDDIYKKTQETLHKELLERVDTLIDLRGGFND